MTEAAVLAALVHHGHEVLIPFGDGSSYDLVVDSGERMIRVQCKTGRLKGACVDFNSCSTDHGRGRQDYRGRADVFGVFCPAIDRVFIVPVDVAAGFVTRLRLEPARNNQRLRTHDAELYDVALWRPAASPFSAATGSELCEQAVQRQPNALPHRSTDLAQES